MILKGSELNRFAETPHNRPTNNIYPYQKEISETTKI